MGSRGVDTGHRRNVREEGGREVTKRWKEPGANSWQRLRGSWVEDRGSRIEGRGSRRDRGSRVMVRAEAKLSAGRSCQSLRPTPATWQRKLVSFTGLPLSAPVTVYRSGQVGGDGRSSIASSPTKMAAKVAGCYGREAFWKSNGKSLGVWHLCPSLWVRGCVGVGVLSCDRHRSRSSAPCHPARVPKSHRQALAPHGGSSRIKAPDSVRLRGQLFLCRLPVPLHRRPDCQACRVCASREEWGA